MARPKLGGCQGWRKGVEHSGKARGKLKANRKVSGNILNDLPPAVMRCPFLYIYMCMLSKNMTSISILMLPTSLFDPIHVRFFRLITVELPQSMSTVEYHEVLVHLSQCQISQTQRLPYHLLLQELSVQCVNYFPPNFVFFLIIW